MKNVLLALKVFVLLCPAYSYAENLPIPFKNGEAVIVLKDDLKHPFFWWPVTLLQYQVKFDKGINLSGLSLTEKETGKSVPFQLSGMAGTANGEQVVTVNILSNLPSGVHKTFILKPGKAQSFPAVSTQVESAFTTIRTNRLTVRIPNSQQVTTSAPGPVVQVAQLSQSSMGQSVFYPGKKQLQQIKTEKTADGPLFAAYRVTYLFKDGAKYIANVKCINDYDFIELNEEISGIKQEDSVSWKLNWTGFQPTHRQAPNHPYGQPGTKPGFARFDWETIEQKKLNYHHGIMPDQIGGKVPYEVGIYEPWPAERTLTSTLFWDEKKSQSLGVFITDAAQWNDMDYAIWHSSKILSIRFFYNSGILTWEYPVSQGTRATAISCYSHTKDIDYMNDLEEKSKGIIDPLGFKAANKMSQLSYNTFLQNRYGTIHLDKVKDWDLTYPDSLGLEPVIFKNSRIQSGEQLMKSFLSSSYNTELTISGPRQNSGYAPVPAREFNHNWVDAFNRFYGKIPNKEGKARTAAMYLMHAYVAADEEYMPMKYMLSGHPNFLADVKTIPALAAYQFPNHPMAGKWGDLFEKYVELNTRYHTRPSVKAWDAQGGRWTENLGTYVWAFLRPTLRTAYVLKESSGKNRVATPGMAQVGSWILNALSAPYNGESIDFYRDSTGKLEGHYWGVVSDKEGPRRVHPPQGAHAERRKPASSLWFLGSMLNRYDPLLSEHLRYVAKPTDDDMESFVSETEPFNIMFPKTGFDRGTRPDFKSIKLTGYGNILRAAVDTKDELSVHLGQIDEGPNYRQGTAGQGGSGMIYFYAAGKSYSHNGREDVGDRKLQDTDLLTSFGVYKDGYFKSIGQNVLSRPLYNLGTGQFTEIVPSQTSNYSWPEYQGRSIMLVGSDYFITYDDVYNNNIGGRFSWFTHPKEEMPTIKIVKIGTPRAGYKTTKVEGDESKGVWYDMLGDCMAFVSHKTGFAVSSTDYGAIVKTPAGQTDYIFRNDKPLEVSETDKVFAGTAGFIRVSANGEQELVLFHGTKIGNGDFTISTADTDAGISAKTGPTLNGRFYSLKPAAIRFEWKGAVNAKNIFYIDGNKTAIDVKGNALTVQFPAGEHQWQFTEGAAIPVRPQIDYSEDDNGRVNISYHATAASKYLVEYSNDNGDTWKTIGETTKTTFTVKQDASAAKAHIRVKAVNGEYTSEASPFYPVYFTREKPLYPDGLKTALPGSSVNITWGKVLGVSGYKLYRRKTGDKTWQVVFTGNANSFDDKVKTDGIIYEYAISSVNKNGESVLSLPVSTDPDSWLHWEPQPDEKFRRTNTHVVADKNMMYYPD